MDPMTLIPLAVGAVLLLGVIIGLITVLRGAKAGREVDLWSLGAYGLWTGGEDCATWEPQRAQNALSNWYGAESPGAFHRVVKGLREGQTGNPAWDKVRA